MAVLIFLLAVLVASPCFAFTSAVNALVSSGVAAASCTELTESGATGSTQQPVSTTSGTEYVAAQFAAGDWGTVSKIQVYLNSNGDISGITYTLQLYADSSDDPGTKVTNGSCTFPGTAVTAGGAYVGCVLSTPVQLTNTTKYHLGVNRGATLDNANFVRWFYDATGGGGYDMNKDTDESGAWTAIDFDAYGRFKLYTGAGCTGN